jgi:hypothetical protein
MSRWTKRCSHTGKIIYPEKVAVRRANLWKADEKGVWNGYQCHYDSTHWHVGHTKLKEATMTPEELPKPTKKQLDLPKLQKLAKSIREDELQVGRDMTPEERKIDEIFDKLFARHVDYMITEAEAKASLLQMFVEARIDEVEQFGREIIKRNSGLISMECGLSNRQLEVLFSIQNERLAQLNPKEKES